MKKHLQMKYQTPHVNVNTSMLLQVNSKPLITVLQRVDEHESLVVQHRLCSRR